MEKQTNFIPWSDIRITDGFWHTWQDIAAKNTSRAIYDRFYETGRINAMNLDWKEGMPGKPHVFWDSDIAKWMEGTAYFLKLYKNEELQQKLESVIDKIEQGQTEDGYFNSAFLTLTPEKRFTDRTDHELYTAGHLIEAAIAHYQATQNPRFLNMMKRFADLIETVFVKQQSAPYQTPGHQELELALIRLYEATGERRYLELSRHFVDMRGTNKNERVFSVPNGTFPADPPLHNQLEYDDTYAQDDAPARKLSKAGGHAVRAMYYYSAMADLAREYQDTELEEACKRLWDDSVNKKMYVTGGVSAERYGEAIGTDYVLPNALSYAETCASVAMANFSMRMFKLEHDGKYADMIERQMYNGALVGLAMDGNSFYYDNALQCRVRETDFFTQIHARPLYPAYQRQNLFECSCCPPNIYRFIAALGQYFYSVSKDTVSPDTLFVHQYASSTATLLWNEKSVSIEQKTDYPWNGSIRLIFHSDTVCNGSIALRIPAWCTKASCSKNGSTVQLNPQNGYLYLDGPWQDNDEILLILDMPVVQLSAHPSVVDAAGKIALKRGPIVYCVEGTDNPNINLFHLTLPAKETDCAFETEQTELCGHTVTLLHGNALLDNGRDWENSLYRPYAPQYTPARFTAIPYFSWSNRKINDMTVWIKKQY